MADKKGISQSAGEQPKRCLLALEDGETYSGYSFGTEGTSTGELVFNTSLSGYQEILTDPSYAGQIVTLTYPEIGNYGTNKEDLESRQIFARGLVIRHLSRRYSNWRATASLHDFLVEQGIMGIYDVDTRAITRHIRDKGAMRSAMSSVILDPAKLVEIAKQSAEMEGADLTEEVSAPKPYKVGVGKYQVAVMDFGVKKSILEQLAARDMALTVYPSSAKAQELLAAKPDAIFLSNGPGDPAACAGVLEEMPKLIQSGLPIFGICLGHQLLCISMGAKTYKLKFGHRGGNQPVKDLLTGKVEITCQNHGFAVAEDSMPDTMELTHVNLNDHSVEGFRHKTLPIFGVQYHPESSPGPHDANYLFERFYDLIESHKKVSV